MQKSNSHRDIRIRSVSAADLETNGTFFQEYIGRPLLVDGHKFDIGVYTVMTSLDPLRVYVYWGDVLLRWGYTRATSCSGGIILGRRPAQVGLYHGDVLLRWGYTGATSCSGGGVIV